ncbi:alkaline phosphatase [bacterium]|nr:alkaline phosphatase [bacterium]
MKKTIALFLFILLCSSFYSFSPISQSIGPEKPQNIILMIGDGMGLSQITAGLIAKGNKLELERCKHVGLIKTFSHKNLITDSAAAATALACGRKTYNGAISVDPYKQLPLPTILEIAHNKNLATGLVATSYIQHATPACFYAHQDDRNMYEEITEDLLSGTVDIAIGGGRRFIEEQKDPAAFIKALSELGYEYFTKLKDAKKMTSGGRAIILAAEDHLPSISSGRGSYLSKASEFAIEKLTQIPDKKGFFLMIEGSQIDWGGHANDKDYIINEVVDFDKTIGEVLDFADENKNTLVIITADHETGGFAIEGGSYENKVVTADFTTGGHSGTMVPIFAYGPGADLFTGIFDNTGVFRRMMKAYGFGPM